jgi:N-acetylmuramoyl-L-alanine amidase
MRHHRARFLHILAIAPVAAILAGVLGPTPHALAAGSKAPVPIVVTVDPGHGGQPTPAHPGTRFDPGAIGTNGLLEKDVDLDVGKRLAALLRADLVNVVMTRSTDVYVSPARRVQISTAHHPALVVSVHAASAGNPQTGGSVVLYPSRASAAYAQTVGDALNAQLATEGLSSDGVSLGDPAWIQSRVPTATVEMGYLSNRTDAALMATASFRQDVAIGMRDGIEAYMPGIVARRDAIRAWQSGHHGAAGSASLAPASAVLPGTKGFQFGPVIAWLAGICAVGLVLLFRDAVARVLVVLGAVIVRLLASVMWLRRATIRRKRRRQRTQSFARIDPEPEHHVVGRRTSVYDDIPL